MGGSNQKFTVAVLGLGYFSQFHLRAWQTIPDATLVAVTDLSAERRTWAVEQGAPVVATSEDVLAQAPDIVDVVLPPSTHATVLPKLAAPGRVFICQKPFCTSLDEARGVQDQLAQAGTTLVIHENFRFQPWYRTVKSFLDAGHMGAIYSARFALRPGDGRGPDAYLDRQPTFQSMPQFLIRETGVHFIDLFQWLFGDVRSVYADIRQLNPALRGEDAGLVILEHATGVTSVLDGNRLSDHVAENLRNTMGEMHIEGEGGALSVDGYGDVWHRPFGAMQAQQVPLVQAIGEGFGGGCVQALNAHVIKALQGQGALENEDDSYLSVVALAEMAYASAAAGRKLTRVE